MKRPVPELLAERFFLCRPLDFFRGKYLAYKFFQHFVLLNTPICVGFLNSNVEGGDVLV